MQTHHTTAAPLIPRDETIGRLLAYRRIDALTGCWLWTGALSQGYGVLGVKGRSYRVHRLSAHLFNGYDLSRPTMIMHLCHTPPCFNPAHLLEGTGRENQAAKWRRYGTTAVGSAQRPALTREIVFAIRRALVSTRTEKSIAQEFGVPPHIVNGIRRGLIYRHYSELCVVQLHAEGAVYELRLPEIVLTNLLERYGDDESSLPDEVGAVARSRPPQVRVRPTLRRRHRLQPDQAPPAVASTRPLDRATAPIYALLKPPSAP